MKVLTASLYVLLWGLTIAGCGDTVTVRADGAILVTARDGDGPWMQLVPDEHGDVSFDVTSGRYALASFCLGRSGSPPWAQVTMTTIDEAAPAHCWIRTAMVVSGETSPGAAVFVGPWRTNADGNGRYALLIERGRYDVAVLRRSQTEPRLLIEHDVDLTATRTLDLPVETEGAALKPVPWPVVGEEVDAHARYLTVRTPRGTLVELESFANGAWVPVRRNEFAGDDLAVGAYELGDGGTRRVEQPLGVATPGLRMPTWNTSAVRRWAVTWDGDWDHVRFDVQGSSSQVLYDASAAWFNDPSGTNVLPLVDLATLPGWQPGMAELPAGQVTWRSWISRGERARDFVEISTSANATW